mgnify:CR=1 FL=1
MSSLRQGILGFVSGYAGSQADQMEEQRKLEQAEALRLRKEEAALLKERRLLQIKSEHAAKIGEEALATDGLIDPTGAVVTTDLDPDLAQMANRTNIRALRAEQVKRDTKRVERSEQPIKITPGTTITTEKALTEKLGEEGGEFTTEFRPTSKSTVKTNYTLTKQDTRASVKSDFGNFNTSQRQKLSDASLDEIVDPTSDEFTAYKAMTGSIALNSVIRDHDSQFQTNPAAVENLTSSDLYSVVQARATEIDQDFGRIAESLADKMQAEVDAGLGRKEIMTVARKLINEPSEFTMDSGQVAQFAPKSVLKASNSWHDSMESILMNTLTSVRPTRTK